MKIKEYLKKKKISQHTFSAKIKVSRYSLHKYIRGQIPARKQAWTIFNETDGEVTFEDMGFKSIPKNPLKDF